MTTRRPAAEPINVGGELVYTAAQVQRLLDVCKATLREARASQGLIASRRAGRDWYFESDLLAWLRAGRCSRREGDAVEGAAAPVAFHRDGANCEDSQQNEAREGR